jgi:hypothetical protein
MREVHCPHCNATNRRPKCGSCQNEIDDPAAIEFAWKLYEHRRYGRYIGITLLIGVLAVVLWHPWETNYFFPPTNLSECREQAARSAKSDAAMRVLLGACSSKFYGKNWMDEAERIIEEFCRVWTGMSQRTILAGATIAGLAIAFTYWMSADRSSQPRLVKALPVVPGWEELGSCANLVSFKGNVYLTLYEDHAVTINKESTSSDQVVGKWTFEKESKQFAVTVENDTTAYTLVSPEGANICMLIKGTLDSADLKSSWYALVPDGEEPPDDPYERWIYRVAPVDWMDSSVEFGYRENSLPIYGWLVGREAESLPPLGVIESSLAAANLSETPCERVSMLVGKIVLP